MTLTRHLHCRGTRHLEFELTPVQPSQIFLPDQGGGPTAGLFIALGRDVTAPVRQRQKLEALHLAGRDLTALPGDDPTQTTPQERVEALKGNIRRLTRDLLRYEVIEIRLLDRATGLLRPLLQDGMTPEAADRILRASPEGNGVTGYVAATGRSYVCHDTSTDPLYLPGAPAAHSSLTVPLVFAGLLIGTLNVESPCPGAFGEGDRLFAEIFSHDVAAALHTLELLSAEKSSGRSESVDQVLREVALPVDDILADAASLLDRGSGQDPGGGGADSRARLLRILANARLIKQSIRQAGEEPAPFALAVPRSVPPPPFRGVRVLVADNDDRVRRSAHGLLGRWGCVVETARDGHEALTMARLSAYDAILADIRLPDLPGYEAFCQLSAVQPGSRVILMTGYGYDPSHALVKARQDGLRHVLFKPFRVDQVRDALTGLQPVPTPGS